MFLKYILKYQYLKPDIPKRISKEQAVEGENRGGTSIKGKPQLNVLEKLLKHFSDIIPFPNTLVDVPSTSSCWGILKIKIHKKSSTEIFNVSEYFKEVDFSKPHCLNSSISCERSRTQPKLFKIFVWRIHENNKYFVRDSRAATPQGRNPQRNRVGYSH